MYDTKKIRAATSKEEQCKIEIEKFDIPKENMTIEETEEYHKYCPKSKSSNIISCPKEIIKNDLKLKWLNDYFKKIAKKSKKAKKKKSKKRNKKKTKKAKVKKHKSKKKKKTKGQKRKSMDRKKRKRTTNMQEQEEGGKDYQDARGKSS